MADAPNYRDARLKSSLTPASTEELARAAQDAADANEAAPWDDPELRRAEVSAPLHGQRLDKVLVALAPEFSRNHLQSLIEAGHVRVDGQVCDSSSRKLVLGQSVEFDLVPTLQSQAFRAEPLPIDIVHEDPQLLVLNKRVGWVVHPAAGNWSGTVLNALLAHHAGAAELPRAGIVHRLDKDTSGLLVVAKTAAAFTALSRAIAARQVHREYLAIAHGALAQARMRIELPVGRDPKVRVRMAVVASGKPARTDVQRLVEHAGFSALRCTLFTGRTHQIRVHLAASGHPLIGDTLYGGSAALGMQRQALHAARLEFVHPHTGKTIDFESKPPQDFEQAWSQLFR